MDTKIIFLYCLADAISKTLKMREDPQSKMTQAKIITFVMISALFYQGNYQMTRQITQSCRYFSKLLSHSRLIRRIHQIDESVWFKIFAICRDFVKREQRTDYIVDSYPVAVCENYKRLPCKLFPGEKFHGYTASKKQYFFGIKVHMLVNSEGVPIEFVFSPGGESDIRGFRRLNLVLPKGVNILADKAYTDYELEDFLNEALEIAFIQVKENLTLQGRVV